MTIWQENKAHLGEVLSSRGNQVGVAGRMLKLTCTLETFAKQGKLGKVGSDFLWCIGKGALETV